LSDREYFSIRYSIPGYIFILFIIAVNCFPLLKLATPLHLDSFFGAFLAFVSLLAGSALGFLISQLWYLYYEHRGSLFGIPELRHIPRPMLGKLKLSTGERANIVLDYLLNKKPRPELWRHLQRRIDMYNTLSCTGLSLAIGYSLGMLLRIYFYLLPLHAVKLTIAEFWIQEGLWLCFGFLLLILCAERNNPLNDFMSMLDAIINDAESDEEALRDLHRAFPNKPHWTERARFLKTRKPSESQPK
jgi:hypothetical protein